MYFHHVLFPPLTPSRSSPPPNPPLKQRKTTKSKKEKRKENQNRQTAERNKRKSIRKKITEKKYTKKKHEFCFFLDRLLSVWGLSWNGGGISSGIPLKRPGFPFPAFSCRKLLVYRWDFASTSLSQCCRFIWLEPAPVL